MEVVKFFGLLAMTWLIVEGSEPIQFIKHVFGIHPDKMPKHWAKIILTKLFDCCLCTGFWVGFTYYLITWNDDFILLACLVSICSELFGRLLNLILNHLSQWKK